eukprot:7390542-Prymnesium_polylepis.3
MHVLRHVITEALLDRREQRLAVHSGRQRHLDASSLDDGAFGPRHLCARYGRGYRRRCRHHRLRCRRGCRRRCRRRCLGFDECGEGRALYAARLLKAACTAAGALA